MILQLDTVTKDYIWGGTRLREEFGKIGGKRLAESWELSVHPDGMCRVSGGEFHGMTLREFVEKIVIHESEALDGKRRGKLRRQEIEIYYSFVGKVELPD